MSKTTHPRKPARAIQIFRTVEGRESLLAVRHASSPGQALRDYFADHLKAHGYKKPLVRGNVMNVLSKGNKKEQYKAV